MAESFAQGAGVAGAQLMGDLARGTAHWEVYLETALAPDGAAVRGRLHFVQADRRRQSAWIFLERTDHEVRERFADFSSSELWALLESLGP
jgi:hypothetical protein